MHPLYDEFIDYLDKEDKENCVKFVLDALENNKIDILTLYKELFEPSLNRFYCNVDEESLCIWKEHIRTSIIRTLIELCYPYILEERKKKNIKKMNIKVLVGCPAEEYHDTGAKMIADMFTLYGFDAYFVGANTPREEIRDAINILKPKYIAISVTNYYSIMETEKAICLIREHTKFDGKIIVGGTAFLSNPNIFKQIGADLYLENYSQIKELAEAV
ncbi:MAG: cobalamin-binding protein [Candidatus Lokiarchaeota archaeon]|nr:cobalamin-binding protein [Candidatus Lokiarchaeota archaeon]MBD3340824.1 cobalamin-binding protein [Candidatus Lokiarchaeota archaeon]